MERRNNMIYTDSQLKEKIVQMINDFENEVVEFKEAKSNYSFNDIGKYFSALSNEANIRGMQEAWLIFGISNDKKYVGTEFRKQNGLQNHAERFVIEIKEILVMRKAKSAPACLNDIAFIKTVHRQENDREINKEQYEANERPFQNTFKFYHNDVPLVSA